MKRILLIIAMTMAFATPAQAAEQGIYYSGSDPAALDYVKSTGLTFVIASPSRAMEQALAERGLGAYWYLPPNSFDTLEKYASSPVTRGWYIADEPAWSEGGKLRSWSSFVRSVDTRPTLSVHWGCTRGEARSNLLPFKDGADWLGVDCYPVGVNSSKLVGPPFQTGARTAHKLGKTFWAVTQAASWNAMCGIACGRTETRWPSWREMQIMRDCATAAGAKVIAWYSLADVMEGGTTQMANLAKAVRSPQGRPVC